MWELIRLANRHPRVNILKPGPGVGGHCIAVDPWFIVSNSPDESRLIRTARRVNDSKPKWVMENVKSAIAQFLLTHPDKRAMDVTIACFGLTFKPNIDDLRESPALAIAQSLAKLSVCKVLAVEPNVSDFSSLLPQSISVVSALQALRQCGHMASVLVDHAEFKFVTRSDLEDKAIIDTVGAWS